MLGLYYEDDDLVWNALDPNLRVDEKGKKGIAKQAAKLVPRDALITAIKTLASNKVSLDHIQMNETRCIQINGKWYISPILHK